MPASRTRASVSSRSLIVARGDHLAVELRRGVEIVVVVVEPGGLERLGLAVLQHAERAARLETRAPSPRAPSRAPARDRAPSARATRRPCRSASRRCAFAARAAATTAARSSSGLVLDAGVVALRLRAIAAILGTAAGLDRHQRARAGRCSARDARDASAARGTGARETAARRAPATASTVHRAPAGASRAGSGASRGAHAGGDRHAFGRWHCGDLLR